MCNTSSGFQQPIDDSQQPELGFQQHLEQLYAKQLQVWPLCQRNYAALDSMLLRELTMPGGCRFVLQYNPARIKSVSAKVSGGKVDRACFLCRSALPPEQIGVEVRVPESGHLYRVLLNPYPLTHHHWTIVADEHTRQNLSGREADMRFFAHLLPDYLVFFNGACSGASAPDHFHFQAVPQQAVPMLGWGDEAQAMLGATGTAPALSNYDATNVVCWMADAPMADAPVAGSLVTGQGKSERWCVFARKAHRPWQYAAEGAEQVLISPAALECCGLVPLARKEDFDKMDEPLLDDIMHQVVDREPRLRVGIVDAPYVEFAGADGVRHRVDYRGEHQLTVDGKPFDGEWWVFDGQFTLFDVVIGKEFHWQQTEDQSFVGQLCVLAAEGCLHAINYIGVEAYLRCVIASEMSDKNNLTLLKTHAIISRSWVLRQIRDKKNGIASEQKSEFVSEQKNESDLESKSEFTSEQKSEFVSESRSGLITENKQSNSAVQQHVALVPNYAANPTEELLYWYDHDNHTLFDVCADDHCQRYQGTGRVHSPLVDQAIAETRGVVLVDRDGEVCDARFSKCCGGVSERFSACWQDREYHYLSPVVDAPEGMASSENEGHVVAENEGMVSYIENNALTTEAGARRFIEQSPAAFCHTTDAAVLGLVLNNYDQSTTDFYRWTVDYTQAEVSALVEKKLGLGLGDIVHIEPLERGASARIFRLRLVGTRRSMVIGKELIIRKALSETHLYSSAFVVDDLHEADGLHFRLRGAGWGHGVGLCQIGAACMSLKGYTYEQILVHYFRGARLQSVY